VNAFAKHGIKHLSPSSLNLWSSAPGIWTLRYLAKVQDEGAPAMWRGTAVERGLEIVLRGGPVEEAQAFALKAFEDAALGQITDDLDRERAMIPGMVARAADWHADMLGSKSIEPLAATQLRVETWLSGVSIPVIGYVDFTFMDGADVDLKTTKACPSKPKPDHLRQIALYRYARSRPGALLYVTDKRHAFYAPSDHDLDEAIYELTDSARSLERFLSLVPDAETAIRCMPMDTSHYAFSPAYKTKLLEMNEAF